MSHDPEFETWLHLAGCMTPTPQGSGSYFISLSLSSLIFKMEMKTKPTSISVMALLWELIGEKRE